MLDLAADPIAQVAGACQAPFYSIDNIVGPQRRIQVSAQTRLQDTFDDPGGVLLRKQQHGQRGEAPELGFRNLETTLPGEVFPDHQQRRRGFIQGL